VSTEPTIALRVTDTELQMIREAVGRVKPYADLSPELAKAEERLEHKLSALASELRGGESNA
jgi:hypothetical protein